MNMLLRCQQRAFSVDRQPKDGMRMVGDVMSFEFFTDTSYQARIPGQPEEPPQSSKRVCVGHMHHDAWSNYPKPGSGPV